MKVLLFFISFFLSVNSMENAENQIENSDKETCISPGEMELYNAVNEYRKQHKLKPIPLSQSLTIVAQTHVHDLIENKPFDEAGNCNPHSWSNKGKWTACCYNSGSDGACMWNKPGELTSYKSVGYEIIMNWYDSSDPYGDVSAEDALQTWKESPNHNNVILNNGMWKSLEWNAMGVGIYQGFAAIWFGEEPDSAG